MQPAPEASESTNPTEPSPSGATSTTPSETCNDASSAAASAAPAKAPEEVAREVLEEHQVRVFRPSNVRFNPRLLDVPDNFFEPTAAELAESSKQLSLAVQRLQDAPLKTRKMRQLENERKMARFKNVLIRILFPDRFAIQGIFKPQHTIRKVQRFVKAALLDARNVKFHLFVVPPKKVFTDLNQTLWDAALVPAAVVHIAVENASQQMAELLKPELIERMEDTPESKAAPPPPSPPVAAPSQPGPSRPSQAKKKGSKKVPKWFKKK